jgi:hypothetical protein
MAETSMPLTHASLEGQVVELRQRPDGMEGEL